MLSLDDPCHLQAVLSALLWREGGGVVLPASQVEDSEQCRVMARKDREGKVVLVTVQGPGRDAPVPQLLDDALWARLAPLFPPPRPRRTHHPGRKPLDFRRLLTGVLFVLKVGIAWDDLPKEMGCGCGATCLKYLKAWQQDGTWDALRKILQAELKDADQIDWERATRDAPPAKKTKNRGA